MANKLSRSPGDFAQVTGRAAVGDVPDFAVDTGAGARILATLGGTLSQRLGALADDAAAREGAQAGMTAGQRAGARYVEKATGDSQAAAEGGPSGAAARNIVVGPGDVSAGPQSLSSVPLQLRHDGTIRGEAFDAAALKTYGWRFQEGLANDLGQAAADNADSPAGFEKAVAGVQQKYLADGLVNADPQIREVFDKTLAERVAPARLAIAARHEAALKAAAKAAADDGTEAVRAELERNAYALGGNPAADTMLAPSIARALTAIDREVKDGTFTPKEGAAKKQAITDTVASARTQGTFDALPTPQAKQDFALGVMQDWASGKAYQNLSLEKAQQLSNNLYQRATVAANQLTASQKAQKAQVEGAIKDDVASIAGSGQGIDPKANNLDPATVQTLIGQRGLDKWQQDRATALKAWQSTAGMELETPAELQQRLDAIKPVAGQPDYAEAKPIYDAAVKRRDEILEERKTDPLGQANRGGLIKLTALDTTTPEGLVNSLQQRAQQARVVSQTYGTPTTIFRPEERVSLTNALLDNPTLLPQFARTVDQALGPDAGKALSELSDAGPELAHAAGISLATGQNDIADDIARVIQMRKDKTAIAKMPTDNVLGDAAGAILGSTLAQNDATRAAVVGTANLLFEKDANALGFDAGAVNKPGSAAAAAYARAIDRALGARMIDGVKYGGMSAVNGVPMVAPSFMPADKPEQLVTSIRDSDLPFLPPIGSGNGVPVSASQLRSAHLVTVGDGLYRVALGDPQSLDPRYVTGKNGGYWTLDLKRLDALHSLNDFGGNPAQPDAPLGRLLDRLRGTKPGTDAP